MSKRLDSYFTKEDVQVANKHVKRCSVLFIFREMVTKTTVRHHYTPIRITLKSTKCCQECKATGILVHCWWRYKMVQSLCKIGWQFLWKLNILSLYDAAILLLGIYSREIKPLIHTKPNTQMFREALFLKFKSWKQPEWPHLVSR